MTLGQTIFILTIFIGLTACSNQTSDNKSAAFQDTVATKNIPTIINCDSFQIDRPKIKNYKSAYKVWLETTSLDWFLENRQSAWRQAKTWYVKTFSIDSNSLVKCICNGRENIFLYVPNHYYRQAKNGNEYFQFYLVNNSTNTLQIPRLDNVIDNISTSVSIGETTRWLTFQQTNEFIDCGNSIWTQKLSPKTAIIAEIESDYINVGDTTVDYRIELTLGKQTFFSNQIKVNLMRQQLPYLGKKFE